MKKIISVLFVFFSQLPCFAQVIHDSGNHGLMLVKTKENENMRFVSGSPYLQSDFQYGTVMVKEKEPLKVFLRYNVLQDQVEIKTDVNSEEKTYLLPKKESTTYQIGSSTFGLDHVLYNGQRISGYFIERYNGQKLRLLEKPLAIVTEAVKAKTGYERDKPATIKIEEEYFIVNRDGKVEKVRLKHRDIKKAFRTDRAKNYLSENKIRSKEDLISFVSYMDRE